MRSFTDQELCDFTVALVRYLKGWCGDDLIKCVGVDINENVKPLPSSVHIVAEQLDALIDIVYYTFNALAKKQDEHFLHDPYFGEMYQGVQQFTIESTILHPLESSSWSDEEAMFLSKMILSELCELLDTRTNNSTESVDIVRSVINNTQVDGCYIYHVVRLCELYSRKLNVDFASAFDVVHQANMNKRNPQTGKFERREDGKIIKPIGWTAPNMASHLLSSIESKSVLKVYEFINDVKMWFQYVFA